MQRSVVVALPEGLHARPAAQFVAAAGRLPAKVTIARPGGAPPVATASILAIMTLGVGAGDEVVLETTTDDDDAAASIDALEGFLRQTA